ncbi:MAG: bifunctional nicotinamidase/pyrazinamidase [Gammaproteobacteria bacterium]
MSRIRLAVTAVAAMALGAGCVDTTPPADSSDAARSALIIVDMQYDFLPGGALATKGGDQIIPLINQLQPAFDLVVATQDWHPADHGSFASQHAGKAPGEVIDLNGLEQVLWPDHAVQETRGAELADALDQHRIARVFQKGTDPTVDSYSGFFDNGQRGSTGLSDYLLEQGVTRVAVVGLALDYCVKYTALDARRVGFDTTLIRDASRAVNLKPDDGNLAIAQMRGAGVKIVDANTLIEAVAE